MQDRVYSGVCQQSKKPASVSDFAIETAVFFNSDISARNRRHHNLKFSNFNIQVA